jgi:hypothetical protein
MRTRLSKLDKYGNACMLAAKVTPSGYLWLNPVKVIRGGKPFWRA